MDATNIVKTISLEEALQLIQDADAAMDADYGLLFYVQINDYNDEDDVFMEIHAESLEYRIDDWFVVEDNHTVEITKNNGLVFRGITDVVVIYLLEKVPIK